MLFRKTKRHISTQTDDIDDPIFKSNSTELIKCGSKDMSKNDFVNWDKNRPPDTVRIQQILEYYQTNDVNLVPGVIHVWRKGDKNIVYDGIHRLLAAFACDKNLTLLLQIYHTDKEQDIIDHFLNINKSISVPSIYLEETSVLKRLVCENVATDMCNKYPSFVSPSRKPFVYNFNRDNLIEFIASLNIDFSRPGVDKQINNELTGLNHVAADFVVRNKIKCPKKCDFHKFYLWYLDKAYIKHRIETVLGM